MNRNVTPSYAYIILISSLAIIISVIFITYLISSNNLSNEYMKQAKNNNKNTIQNIQEQNSLKDNEAKIIKNTPLYSFTTNITYPDSNRNKNIEVACNYLNDTIIKAYEIFSFNEKLGPFNEEQGYVESTGFDTNGNIIPIVGGGICQVSSTLYNIALMANFEIIERHAHSAPVNYVPEGKDATICYNNVDLKFKNTFEFDVKLKCIYTNETVTIELYKQM